MLMNVILFIHNLIVFVAHCWNKIKHYNYKIIISTAPKHKHTSFINNTLVLQ